LISVVIIFLSVLLAISRTSWFGHAQEPTRIGSLSLENSYLFASPISAYSDGETIVRITVFLLDDKGLGVSGQNVVLKIASGSLNINKIQPLTDSFGRAIFDLTSTVSGDYKVSADISGVTLPQEVSISFL